MFTVSPENKKAPSAGPSGRNDPTWSVRDLPYGPKLANSSSDRRFKIRFMSELAVKVFLLSSINPDPVIGGKLHIASRNLDYSIQAEEFGQGPTAEPPSMNRNGTDLQILTRPASATEVGW